jgi:integrase
MDCIIELLGFIEKSNMDNFKFNIDYEKVRLVKPKPKIHDSMDSAEFNRFSKVLPRYLYDSDFEKCRNILICRILLYSGITPSELLSLDVGKNFIIGDKTFIIVLDNRKVDIELPRNKIVRHFNKYMELKENRKDTKIFYDVSVKQINEIVKSLLEFASIKRRDMNATLLRVSFAVYLYNSRENNLQYNITTIQHLLGHSNRADTENMIGFHDKKYASISDVFDKEDFS